MGTSSLLYNEPPLVVPPSLAVALGLNEAIVLQQLHFWLGNKNVGIERDGYKWIHNTYEQWKENFPFWSERTIQRIFVELEKRGVVMSAQFNSATWDKTKFYRINYERLEQIKNTPIDGTGGGTIEDDKLALSDDDKLAPSLKSIDYKEAETTEELLSRREKGELENPSIATPQDSVSPVMEIPEFAMPLVNLAGTLHNATQAVNAVFSEILPTEPTPVKGKTKKAAAVKPPKPPKEPKAPRELDPREAEFLAQVEQLDPFMGKQVESRLRKYRRDKPWSALQVYLLTGKPVPPASLQAVTSLNGTAFDTELMLQCLSAWTSKGWSQYNLAWLLEWYKAGGPPQYGKYGAQQTQPTPAPSKPKIEISDPCVVDFEHWITELPGYGSKSPRSIQLAAWLATNGDYNVAAQHIGDIEELHAEYQAAH